MTAHKSYMTGNFVHTGVSQGRLRFLWRVFLLAFIGFCLCQISNLSVLLGGSCPFLFAPVPSYFWCGDSERERRGRFLVRRLGGSRRTRHETPGHGQLVL